MNLVIFLACVLTGGCTGYLFSKLSSRKINKHGESLEEALMEAARTFKEKQEPMDLDGFVAECSKYFNLDGFTECFTDMTKINVSLRTLYGFYKSLMNKKS